MERGPGSLSFIPRCGRSVPQRIHRKANPQPEEETHTKHASQIRSPAIDKQKNQNTIRRLRIRDD
jgi:hypothetical protein